MAEFIQIHWTCASLEEARRISRSLVEQRLVACANIIPWVESVYMWNNALEVQQESKVIYKTRKENFFAVKQRIKKESSYEIPEVSVIEVTQSNSDYTKWLKESSQDFSHFVE